MFSEPDSDSLDPRDFDPVDPLASQPTRLPPTGHPGGAAEPSDSGKSFISGLYAAAWSMAQRDHELDRLFNAEFYQGGEI